MNKGRSCLFAVILFAAGSVFVCSAKQGDGHAVTVQPNAVPSAKTSLKNKITWHDGITALKAGELTKGLLLLDSFRMSGCKNDTFVELYSKEALNSLVPQKPDSVVSLFRQFTTIDTGLFNPATHFFTVSQSVNRNTSRIAPCYTYGATFELRKPFRLVFSGLAITEQTVMNIGFHYDPTVDASLNRQRYDRKDIASCKLYIDLSATLGSPMQYIRDKINGKFDSISVRHDFSDKQGISLRCITRSRNNDDDSYTAIATFDKMLPDVHTHSNRRSDTTMTLVRYTLIAQSCNGNADRIEARFLTVLHNLL